MNTEPRPKTIADLQRERDEAVARRDQIDAEIKRVDRLLDAYEMLRSHGVVLGGEAPPLRDRPVLTGVEAQRVQARDTQVMGVIRERFADDVFTIPDLVPLLDVSKRSIKRALDDMIERGEVKLVEKGFKRRASKYRLTMRDNIA